MKPMSLLVLCAAATMLVTQNIEIVEAVEPGVYSSLQIQAVGLLPTMPQAIIETIISNGDLPKTPSERYIFHCLNPSVKFFDKRETLSETQFTNQFGDLAVEISQIYKVEEDCLQQGVKLGKIKLIRKASK